MKKISTGLAALAAVALAGTAQAQTGTAPTTPFSLELRGGLAFPTGDFGKVVDNGYSVGADANYMFTRQLGIYGGFTYNSFGLGDLVQALGVDGDLRDYGFDAGIKAMFPTATLPVTPFLKGGAVYHRIQLAGDIADGETNTKSDYSLGFEVGGGFAIPLGPRLSFTPGLTYTSYKPKDESDVEGEDTSNVSHVRVDVGLNIRF